MALTAALIVLGALAAGRPGAAQAVLAPAPTPPMAWNPWYSYRCGVDQTLVKQTAQLIISGGYAVAGYRYVNLDDCWMSPRRDASGGLVADPGRFPDGIAALASYLHGLGLKLGVYLDAGTRTCMGLPGSQGRIDQDARTLSDWGVDFVKVDFCNTAAPAPLVYREVSQAFAAVPRPIVLSVCNWGVGKPWRWAPRLARLWRTTGDYTAYGAPANWWGATLKIADRNARLADYARPGAWNDPDMLLAGTGFLSTAQARAQISLWSMMAAPLIMDAALPTIAPADAAVLTNPEVIALDQDPAGRQGWRVAGGAHQLWVRSLADGARAALLFNAGVRGATLALDMSELGLPNRPLYAVRDLWAHTTRSAGRRMRLHLAPGAVALLRVTAPVGR